MTKINLRIYYPDYYRQDYFIEVSDDVFEAMKKADRQEAAYNERVRYHKAYYYLTDGSYIEFNAINVMAVPTPDKIYEIKVAKEQLYSAIYELSEKQARRIYARYFLNMNLKSIAETEGISVPTVHESISLGLHRLKKILKTSR
ncbi:MAG: sigma-70 family RNA polymerase sigma factor [Clostridiales bacterium]|nr:sigma-70 family RNA polymerase sigma factor [Clostridiales bacterium]